MTEVAHTETNVEGGVIELTTDQRLDRLESREAIGELVANYCHGVDRRDRDTFLGIWHEEAEYLIGAGRGNFSGRDDIARFLDVVAGVWRETYHWTTNHVITFADADSASGISEAFAMCAEMDGDVCFVAARYVDEYRREAGKWTIRRRDVKRWFVSDPQAIQLLAPR